jgi:enoyl-CoA hydratase/carnithine racemase
VVRLTLDRPEKRNALDSRTCDMLVQALEQSNRAAGVGAVLLDAIGPVFCAGMDLDESLQPDAVERTAIHERLFTAAFWMDKPVVAAVAGGAFAGGVGLVANAHLVIADTDAKFSLPEVTLGMWPFVVWKSVVHALGERRTMELALTGRVFSATEALQWGLTTQLVTRGELEGTAIETTEKLAGYSPEVIRRGFDLARRSRQLDWGGAAAAAVSLRAEMLLSEDFREGVRAFREKRFPNWPSVPI